MSSHGEDAPGKSKDTYEQCAICGLVKHDYRHGGGQAPPNYPIYLVRGAHHTTAPECSPDAWKDQDDKALPEDAAIEAAFPTRSKRYDLHAEAMRLVGARYSKGGLVALVNWLLHERDSLRETLDGIPECECRDCIAAISVLQEKT